MGGRSSTFRERIKSVSDLLKDLNKKTRKKDFTILDLGDHTQETSFDENYRNKSRLNDRNYMVCNSINKVDKKIQKITLNQIAYLSHKYSNITNQFLKDQQVKLRSYKINDINIRTQKKYPNYTTMACWSKSTNQICLNQRRMQNFDDMVNSVKYSQSTGHFMQTDLDSQDKYIITHEFGHFIEDCLIQKNLQRSDYSQEERTTEALTITEKICKIAVDKFKATDSDLRKMSRYGYTDAYEWFSELFTKTILSSDKTSLSMAMNEYLKKENIDASNSAKL